MIRALGWDHSRCVEPMLAASRRWRAISGEEVRWRFRPLADFNDQPISEVIDDSDVIILDHPAIPAAVTADGLIAFEQLLEPGRLMKLTSAGIGPSAASYRYGDRTWALAVDAACQVSAFNPDRIDAPPRDWDAVLELARARPGRVALPLLPADSICALLSIAATLGTPVSAPEQAPGAAVEVLSELAGLVADSSWTSAPPALLSAMAETGAIEYVPLVFGYRSFASARLRFADAPAGPDGRPFPVLGGAGVAISSRSPEPDVAAAFAAWLCEPEAQIEVVLAHRGQPAHRRAWLSAVGAESFFADTLASIEHAYVRPAHPAWHDYQRRAGQELHAGLRARRAPAEIAERLEQTGVPT